MLRVRHSSSKRWINRQLNDKFSQDAKALNYRSRAAFKLIELDKRFGLFKKSTCNIIDLGCAPGAWAQVAVEKAKAKGATPNVLGVDLIDITPPEGVQFFVGDIFQAETQRKIRAHFMGTNEITENILPVDIILSDMMANTSGLKNSDHYASMDLCAQTVDLAKQLLRPSGALVMKFYTGKEENLLEENLRSMFSKVHRFKPAACRKELKEMYFVGLKRKA